MKTTVIAKLVKLHEKKNGEYNKNGAYSVKRNRAIVLEQTVNSYEINSKFNGLLYVIDEEATAKHKGEEKKTRGRKPKNQGLEDLN